jgi:alpha-tubulin suppressor-like RCC1 family protein
MIHGLPAICAVSAGTNYSLFLDYQGRVWALGDNDHGQLGLGDTKKRLTPTLIENLPYIKAISASDRYSLFLGVDQVWACGWNRNGHLGIPPGDSQMIPVKIPGLPTIKSLQSGQQSIFLDQAGGVWSCGLNFYFHQSSNIKSLRRFSLPVIKTVSAGLAHILFLDRDDQVWGYGVNDHGQLGLPDDSLQLETPLVLALRFMTSEVNVTIVVRDLVCLTNSSIFFDQDGQVWTCGDNSSGQCGVNGPDKIFSPVKVNLTVSGPLYLIHPSQPYSPR